MMNKIGGSHNPKAVVTYDIKNNKFKDITGTIISKKDPYFLSYSQFYATSGMDLYMTFPPSQVSIFNLKDIRLRDQPIHHKVQRFDACLATSTTHLFVISGLDETKQKVTTSVEVFDLKEKTWASSKLNLIEGRRFASCIVHQESGKLYAIGGTDARGSAVLSIEKMNISSPDSSNWHWETTNHQLQNRVLQARAVAYKSDVIVVGGQIEFKQDIKNFQVIDTNTDFVSASFPALSHGALAPGVIVIETAGLHTMYVFGGGNQSGAVTDKVQSYTFKLSRYFL